MIGPGIYPQWCVMGLAEGKVKVLLDGQGSDELLGGYFYFYADHFADLMRSAYRPSMAWQLLGAMGRVARRSSVADLARFLRAGMQRLSGRPLDAGFKAGSYPDSLSPDVSHAAPEFFATHPSRGAGHTAVSLHREVTQTSLPILLHYEDRRRSAKWSG